MLVPCEPVSNGAKKTDVKQDPRERNSCAARKKIKLIKVKKVKIVPYRTHRVRLLLDERLVAGLRACPCTV